MVKRFLVTGCPRSGTGYAAALFRALGIRCGHEEVFGTEQVLAGEPVVWNGFDGDSSWMAVPALPLDGVVVLHQVRHPLEVIRSIVGTRFLELVDRPNRPRPVVRNRFASVVWRHAKEVFEPETETERAAHFWRLWNERAEAHATFTYRLEDFDAGLLIHLCALLGFDVPQDQAEAALRTTSRRVNTRARDETVSWESIAPFLGELPAHYGY